MSPEPNKFSFEIPLGRYAMNFGAFEWTLIKGIAMLIALDPSRHQDENLSTSFSKRVKRFDKLTRDSISLPPLLETHGGMIAQMNKVAETRNSLLHGPWFDMPGTDIDAEKSKLIEVPIRLGDLLKQNSARRVDLTHGNWTVADESLGIHERTQTCPRERDIHRNRS